MAEALPVRHLVPQVGPHSDGDDMIGVGFPLVTAHATAASALPVVATQHGEPPRLVPAVAVAASRSVRSERPHTSLARRTWQPEHLDPLRHT